MIRVTSDEFLRDTRALYQRARAERESIEVVDELGVVRSIISLGTGEPEADPEDAGGEVYWAVCIGVVALGEWARRCAWDQLDECCTACWGLGIRGPCRRHRRVEELETPGEPDYSGWLLTAEDVAAMVRGDADE